MKKVLAVSLLAICNSAAVFGLSALIFYIMFLIENIPVGIIIGVSALIALGFASSRIFKVFKRKYGMKLLWFILASHIPPIIGMVIYWIVYLSLDAAGYFTGWFAGLGELLFGFTLTPAAVIYLISGAIWSAGTKNC